MVSDAEWKDLMKAVHEIQQWFPDEVAYIGGIAIYAHCMDRQETEYLAARSHDADLMILLSALMDLRDIEVLTSNRRLGKQQFIKHGIEFDVYVEGQHDLRVPADELISYSQIRHGLRVACLEHLLVLKLEAFAKRRGTEKGDKDEDDIVKMLIVGQDFSEERSRHLTSSMIDSLEQVTSGDAPVRIAKGNLHNAKILRHKAVSAAQTLRDIVQRTYGL